MKVSELINKLQELNPDEQICALVYDKSLFDFPDEDLLTLSVSAWEQVVKGFEMNSFDDVWSSISDACMDLALEASA